MQKIMKSGATILGVISAMSSLCGCERRKPIYEDTRALENPPPKPPNCTDSPEISNITLKDGSVANVRLIQITNTILYFPTEWLDRNFVDQQIRFGGFLAKSNLLDFIPDVHSNECPGIIHEFNPEKQTFLIEFVIGGHRGVRRNVAANSELDGIAFSELHSRRFGGGYNSWMVPMKEVRVEFSIRKPDRFKIGKGKSGSVTELVEWLATPPAKRDNGRVFTLKVDAEDSNQ